MYSTDLLLKVPKTILLTGISGDDGKPISAIAWKALLSIMYFFPERDHCEITVPITILHMMFGYYSNSECNHTMSVASSPIWNILPGSLLFLEDTVRIIHQAWSV